MKPTTEGSALLNSTERSTTERKKRIKYTFSFLSLMTIGVLLSYFMVSDVYKKKLSLKLRYAFSDDNTDDYEFYSNGIHAEYNEMESDDVVFGKYEDTEDDVEETDIVADEVEQLVGNEEEFVVETETETETETDAETETEIETEIETEDSGVEIESFVRYPSVLWVGKTIALKYLANGRWVSCWDGTCDLRTCPGPSMGGDNWSRCTGEVFQIFSKGKTWKQPINNCDQVMIYYYGKQKWLGCPNINQCDWRTCPGGRIPAPSKYDQCWGEVFVIYARGKKCGNVLRDDDRIMLQYRRGGDRWVTAASGNTLKATATCPNTQPAKPPSSPKYAPFYRYWQSAARDHFYTRNAGEIGTTTPGAVGKYGYKSEGIACHISVVGGPGLVPLYRYWLPSRRNHFYTTNAGEIGTTTPGRVGRYGYRSEGIAGFVYKVRNPLGGPDLVPLYRYYQPAAVDHFYTTNAGEIGTTTPGKVGRYGYRSEGIAGWCSKTGKNPPPGASNGVDPANWARCWGEVFQLFTPTQTRRIKVGSTLAFKYNRAGRFASCWVPACDLRTCPGSAMDGADWQRCAGEVFRIYARGKSAGQTINSGDKVMIYYPYRSRWMGCPNINQCDWRTCPGSAQGNGPSPVKYSQCWGEVFTIFARFKQTGEPLTELDRIMLRYDRGGSRWVTGASQSKLKAVATCPGSTPDINSADWNNCWGEVFQIYLR